MLPASPQARERLTVAVGKRHDTVTAAARTIVAAGLPLSDRVFSVAREPSALLLSYYKHMRKPHVWRRRGMDEASLRLAPRRAMELSFADFVRQIDFYNKSDDAIADYYRAGVFPKTDVVALEDIDDYLQHRFGHHRNFDASALERRNVSKPKDAGGAVLDDEIRDFVQQKYPRLAQTHREALQRAWAD